MLSQIFGGKPWFKSMTAWGALGLAVAWTLVPGLGEVGLVDTETASTMTGWLTKVSVILEFLGLRKAATTPNVKPE